jgi:hypothetical protein
MAAPQTREFGSAAIVAAVIDVDDLELAASVQRRFDLGNQVFYVAGLIMDRHHDRKLRQEARLFRALRRNWRVRFRHPKSRRTPVRPSATPRFRFACETRA